ncbi:tyrosine-type recombinase/integrase [Acinetobacter seifertii]|uniref:tyrosine-type recombinase/integrase n=1 Tax=Acinetobacter seifertii TaxID=1530123 RepID=UPI000A301EAF|nr:tyrosine-type recombinase/integrase [Acinetobacter seifertii]OUC67341.1 integrase/recombinase, phage associated protein [Acinetobacter seifertii]
MKKRELELELNPEILTGEEVIELTFLDALNSYEKYIGDMTSSKKYKLKQFKDYEIIRKKLSKLKSEDFSSYALKRRNGDFSNGVSPAKATVEQELYYFRVILLHAELILGQENNAVKELDKAMKGLRNARQIDRSETRERLPTNEELQLLTNYFYELWLMPKSVFPLHLIMWLAIYTTRRRGELFSLRLEDDDLEHESWLVRDIKNPKGSKGNNKRFKVCPEARAIINMLLEPEVRKKMTRRNPENGLLLPTMADSTIRVFTDTCKILGIKDFRFHDFRHEGATRLAEKGLSIPQIQQYTLHDSWSSLERYVNLDHKRKKVLEFDEAIEIAKLSVRG